VWSRKEKKERGSVYTYHHHECKNPGGSPSVMFFSHRICEKKGGKRKRVEGRRQRRRMKN